MGSSFKLQVSSFKLEACFTKAGEAPFAAFYDYI